MAARPVAFLSDYGTADGFVGTCEAVIASLAPEARVIHLTHEIAPHDVRAGALALLRAVQYLPGGTVVLAVVDPGVGTDRRLVAVEVDEGVLVGPDNGLLAPAAAMVGGPRRVVALDDETFHLAAPGPTFAGRDVMAPAAADLASGGEVGDLGTRVDPASLVPGLVSLPRVDDDGALLGEVWWVDRFGNCQLNVGPDDLTGAGAAPGGTVEVRVAGGVRSARWVRTYADARPSELVLLVDSHGLCELALDRASAAAELGLREGGAVTVVAPGAQHPG